jgi:AcrR family transcriptional regulator
MRNGRTLSVYSFPMTMAPHLLAAGASAEKRTALLDAAAERFVAVGIGKTTMEDIARGAGAGKATLYRYFPNKAAVVDALVDRENHRFTRVLERAVDGEEGTAARVEAAFVAALEFLRSHPMLNKSLAEEPSMLLPYLTLRSGPVAQSGMALFTRVIREGVASGELRRVHPEWAAETLFRLLMSFFSLPQLSLRIDDPEQVRAYAHGLVAGGLVGR